jgi:hypothetical protein
VAPLFSQSGTTPALPRRVGRDFAAALLSQGAVDHRPGAVPASLPLPDGRG